jgi:hypothetical protein
MSMRGAIGLLGRLLFGVILLGFLAGTASAGPRCSPERVESAGRAVKAARETLAAVPVGDMDTGVDAAAQRGIEALKDRLHDFIRAVMACAPASDTPAALNALLATRGAPVKPRTLHDIADFKDGHGQDLTYAAAAIPGHPGMIGIVATFGIECGDDSILTLYQRRGGRWRELIARRSKPYKDVAGALDGVEYVVSRPDADGHWYLAVMTGTAWCTSAWRGLRFELTRPGRDADRPKVLLSRSVGAYIGYDDLGVMHANPRSFDLRTDGSIRDVDILVRKHVYHYAIAGDRVRRIQPVALNARDFVDEWIDRPWSQSKSLSGPEPGLAAAHSALRRERDRRGATGLHFLAVRRCARSGAEVEVDSDGAEPWFLRVVGKNPFRLAATGRHRSAGCRGPDIKATMDTHG